MGTNIDYNKGVLTNSGSITSTGAIAVETFQGASSVTNQVGGAITGKTYGVELSAGGTVTNAGLISGGTDSVFFTGSGANTLVLQTGSTLVGDAAGSTGFYGATNALILQGAGVANNKFINFNTLTVQAAGQWTLGGASSISTSEVASGTLILQSALTSAFTIDSGAMLQGSTSTLLTQAAIKDNGTLTFDQAATATFAGAITGSGNLRKQNTGTLTLSGTSSVGSTEVASGALIVTGPLTSAFTIDSGATLQGSISTLLAQGAIVDNGSLVFDQATTGTFAGAISGSGALLKQNSGTLTLSGTSSVGASEVAGGTLIVTGNLSSAFTIDSGATLQGSTATLIAQGAIVDNGTLVFDQASAGSFANAINGSGTLVKQNTGLLTLNGVSSIAATVINGGTLQVGDASHPGAQLASAVTVNSGGVLSGHGAVGSVTNNGVVMPGGSIGVLTVQGDYVQGASGTLAIEVTPVQQSKLMVTGQATLAGALQLVVAPGIYRKGASLQVISAAGGVSGAFSSVTSSGALPLGFAQGNSGSIVITQGQAQLAAGATANEQAIAGGLAAYPMGVSDFDPVANAIVGLPQGAVQNLALDQLGGELYADLLLAGRDGARGFLQSVSDRLDDGVSSRSVGAPSVWGQVFGAFRSARTDSNARGYSGQSGGLVFGVERPIGPAAVAGLSISVGHSNLSLQGLDQTGSLDTEALSVYGLRQWGAFFAKGGLAYSLSEGQADRSLVLPGLFRKAHASFDGQAPGALMEAGYSSRWAGLLVQPTVALVYNNIHQDGFTETGAGGAALFVSGRGLDTAETLTGVRLTKVFGAAGVLKLDVRAAWAHELDSLNPQVVESFAAASGSDFRIAGASQDADRAVLGAGLSFEKTSRLKLYFSYQADLSRRNANHAPSLGATFIW